jgi:hypothetical protein
MENRGFGQGFERGRKRRCRGNDEREQRKQSHGDNGRCQILSRRKMKLLNFLTKILMMPVGSVLYC